MFLGDKYTITTFLNSIYYEYIDKPLFINERVINDLLKLIEEYEKENSNIEFLKEININILRRFLNKNIGSKLYINSVYDSNDIRLKYKSTVLKDNSYFKFKSQVEDFANKYQDIVAIYQSYINKTIWDRSNSVKLTGRESSGRFIENKDLKSIFEISQYM